MVEGTDSAVQSERDERKRFDGIWWGGVLIWLGIALAAENLDLLPEIGEPPEWWPWIFVGVGPWSLALNGYRAVSAAAPNPSTWDWVWTVIFLAVALGALLEAGGAYIGATAFVVVGLIILLRAASGRE
jgi:hypothetical protein